VYKFIFESSLEAILLTEPDGNILAANPAAQKLFGYSEEEFSELGRSAIVEMKDPQLPVLLEERRRNGEAKGELDFIRKNGEKFNGFISSHIFKDENGDERSIMTIIDLTEIKKVERSLKKSEERYSITLEAVNDGLWDWDVPSGDAFFSPNYYKLLGYNSGEFPANYGSWKLLVHPEDIDSVEKQLEKGVKSGIGFEIDLRMKTKSGNWLWVSTRGKAIEKDSNGNAKRMVGTLSDITERVNARKLMQLHQIQIKASLDLYKMVDASIKEIIDFVLEVSLKVTESKYAFIGLMSDDELVMDIHAWSKDAMDECSVSESPIHFPIYDAGIWGECVRKRKPITVNNYNNSNLYKKGYPEGHVPIKRFIGIPIFDNDKIVVVAAAANKEENYGSEDEISFKSLLNDMWRLVQRKNDEKEIKKALNEKEMLLKEIHHRVKNNLMVISSLLNLQSRYIKDKEALGIFKESQSRARSMALIHERLYQSTDLKRINFADYIRALAIDLFHTYTSDERRLKLTMDVDDLMLDINTTVPLGMILNELVSNCLKHAFPDDMAGEIKIDFHKMDGEYLLEVNDDGKGFPEDLDFENTQSLGLQIVNSLINQLEGKIELDRSHGTKFTIKFHELEYKERI
jgi:PAS domain S-box-containing protein